MTSTHPPEERTNGYPYDWRAAMFGAVGTLVPALLLVVVIRDGLGWDFEEATVAPLAADRAFGPRYAGWLGSLGVIGWSLAAGAAAMAAAVAKRSGRSDQATMLRWAGAVSLVLMIDDLFMIHHTVAPQLLGVPKELVLLVLLTAAGAWLVRFRRILVRDPDAPILAWSLGWYATALLIDTFGGTIGWGGVREETAKLVGVAAWLVFLWRVGRRAAGPPPTID